MKNIFFLMALLLLYANAALGQTASNTELRDSSNIYYQAFKHYCSYLSSGSNNVLLVEENNITTESIPEQLGELKVEIVDIWELQRKLKKNKSLMLVRIVPLRVKEGRFFVNIIPFNVQRSKSGINYVNSGGSKVEFLYDCTNSTFILEETKNSGI